MTPLVTLKLLAMLAMLGCAAVTDLRERRISNRVTVTGVLAALVISTAEAGGFPGSALLGVALALAVSFPLFALGALGAGDAKLLAAVGAFLGAGGLVSAVLYAGIAGGVMGLISASRRGVILPVLLHGRNTLVYAATLGRRGDLRTIEDPDAHTIPYGVAIALGAVAAWFVPLSLGAAV